MQAKYSLDFLRHKTFWAYFAVVLLPALVFGRSLSFEFLNWDDPSVLTDHHWFLDLSWGNFLKMWNPLSFWRGLTLDYSPVRDASYALDLVLFGWSSAGFHLTQVLLHCLNAGLVLTLFRRHLGLNFATAGALIFALHPLVVEPVAWITGRKDLLMLAGCLLALYFTEREKQGFSIVSGIGGMLAKYSASVIGPTIGLLNWSQKKRIPWLTVISLTLFALGLGILAIATNVHLERLGQSGKDISLWTHWPATLQVINHNLATVLWPANLSAVYLQDRIVHLYNLKPVFMACLILLAWLSGVIYAWRRAPAITYGLLLFGLGMGPNFLQIVSGHPIWMADRYLYMSLVGAALTLAAAGERLARRQQYLVWGCLSIIICLLTWQSLLRLPAWRNSLSLWQDTITKPTATQEPVVWGNLGLAQFDQGLYSEAQQAMQMSLRQRESWPRLWVYLARTRLKLGDKKGARELLENFEKRSTRMDLFKVNKTRAIAWMELGEMAKAEKLLQDYLGWRPFDPEGFARLGLLYEQTERPDRAIFAWDRVLAKKPRHAIARLGRARFFAAEGKCNLALKELNWVKNLRPPQEQERQAVFKSCQK